MVRILFIIIFFIMLTISGYYFKKNLAYEYKEPDITAIMHQKLKNGYLDKAIADAIKNGDFEDVESYIELSRYFNIDLNNTTKELIKEENSSSKRVLRGIENFTKGFLSGKTKDSASIAGSITSDFTFYGDIRDLYTEGNKYLKNEPYDKFILGLSLIGIGLSGATLLSLGGTSGVKVATSTLKLAKREKILSKSFSKILGDKLNKAVNFKALKSMKFSSISALKNDSKILKKSINVKPLKPIFTNISKIYKNTSLADTIHLLKYVDNTKDLKAISKLSKKYKKATRGIFKIIGKKAIQLVKGAIKWSSKLILSALSILLSFLGLFIALFGIKKLIV